MRSSNYFRFVDGVPIPVNEDPANDVRVNKQTMGALLPAALNTPYEPRKRVVTTPVMTGTDENTGHAIYKDVKVRDPLTGELLYEIDPDELQFQNPDGTWMTKAEVGQIRLAQRFAEGEAKAQEQVLDRIIGKPKQEIEQTVTKLDPIGWMRQRMKEMNGTRVTVEPPHKSDPALITVDVTEVKPSSKADYI